MISSWPVERPLLPVPKPDEKCRGANLHVVAEPGADAALDQCAQRRDQEREADDVGQDARRDQEGCGDEEQAPSISASPGMRPAARSSWIRRTTRMPCQRNKRRAEGGIDEHEQDRHPPSGLAADPNQERELQERHDGEQQE